MPSSSCSNILCPSPLKLLFITRDEQLDQCARGAQSTITYLPACKPKVGRMWKGRTDRNGRNPCYPLPTWRYTRGHVSNKECKNPAVSVAFPCTSHTNSCLHASRSMSYTQAWLCMYNCMTPTRIGGQQSDEKALEDSAWMS